MLDSVQNLKGLGVRGPSQEPIVLKYNLSQQWPLKFCIESKNPMQIKIARQGNGPSQEYSLLLNFC